MSTSRWDPSAGHEFRPYPYSPSPRAVIGSHCRAEGIAVSYVQSTTASSTSTWCPNMPHLDPGEASPMCRSAGRQLEQAAVPDSPAVCRGDRIVLGRHLGDIELPQPVTGGSARSLDLSPPWAITGFRVHRSISSGRRNRPRRRSQAENAGPIPVARTVAPSPALIGEDGSGADTGGCKQWRHRGQ